MTGSPFKPGDRVRCVGRVETYRDHCEAFDEEKHGVVLEWNTTDTVAIRWDDSHESNYRAKDTGVCLALVSRAEPAPEPTPVEPVDVPAMIQGWIDADPSLADALLGTVLANARTYNVESAVSDRLEGWGKVPEPEEQTRAQHLRAAFDADHYEEPVTMRELAETLRDSLDLFEREDLFRELALLGIKP